MRDPAGHLGAALVGTIVGALSVLAVGSLSGPAEVAPVPAPRGEPPSGGIEPSASGATTFLVWAPGGLPGVAGRRLERIEGVTAVATVVSGMASTPRDAGVVPLDAAAIEPDDYAAFVPPAEQAAVRALGPDDVLLAATASGIRGVDIGEELALDGRIVHVSGIVDDVSTHGYELLRAAPAPPEWIGRYRSFLVQTDGSVPRSALDRAVAATIPEGTPVRIRAKGESPFLRYGDAVLPEMILKQVFGEFSVADLARAYVRMDPAWAKRNIVTARVPILGAVTCHRILFPQLRSALRAVAGEGLGFLVDPADYGGCYSARHINADPDARLSHHSWGIAIDINVSTNAYGREPNQHPRVVEIFESHGFTWGGRWLRPDGMHFEWVRFP